MIRRPDIDELKQAVRQMGLDSPSGAFAFDSGQQLTKPGLAGRRRTRLEVQLPGGGQAVVYLKRYSSESFYQKIRRLLLYGIGASQAGVERDNIEQARIAGLATMDVLAFGQEKSFLGVKRGFLVVSSVPGDALERTCRAFLDTCGLDSPAAAMLTCRLAELVGKLHRSGYVHRDLYASHIFMETGPAGPELWLIDLARMFRPRLRRFRWKVKDLAQLRYSMPGDWVSRWWDDFITRYLQTPSDRTKKRYNRAVESKVAGMSRRSARNTQTS